ncbi:MAG: hypothetical protein IBV52_01550 [Candidatus Bathyarchaeota archaeon]
MVKTTKSVCVKIDNIQEDLVDQAITLYNEKDFRSFWDAIEYLDIFLSVKEGLGCAEKKVK